MPKTWCKVVVIIISIIFAIFFIGFAALVLSEYFPEDIENVQIEGEAKKTVKAGGKLNIITYNLGYM